jgi:hypothetical protein
LGGDLAWEVIDGVGIGKIEIEVPPSSVIYCVTSYDGVAQSYYWVVDPNALPNARRVAFESVDNGLRHLLETIEKAGQRGFDARDLEKAIGWIAWMLGFGVANLGGSARTQDAPDIIATTPSGNFALIECTTGHLGADKKLPLLHSRAQSLRRRLDEAYSKHVKVLPTIVTNMIAADVEPELERAREFGIKVITREGILDLVNRTQLPNPEAIYAEALEGFESTD